MLKNAILNQARFNLMAGVCHAVVEIYGSGYKDPTALRAVDHIIAEGSMKCINSQIAIGATDTLLSIYWVGDVPMDAILDPTSFYDYGAITSVSDFDIGFYYPKPDGRGVIDADALVDGDDISSAGTQTLRGHGTLTLANSNKRVWELCGLTSNPGGNAAIVATIKATATAAGVVNFTFRYSK